MTDPTTLPDDHVAAGRAYVLNLRRDAEEALGRVAEEAFRYRCLHGQATELIGLQQERLATLQQERDRLAAELAQERALRVMREEELRQAREERNKLEAVAVAVRALARLERWELPEGNGTECRAGRALVAAGYDWREPKEAHDG